MSKAEVNVRVEAAEAAQRFKATYEALRQLRFAMLRELRYLDFRRVRRKY